MKGKRLSQKTGRQSVWRKHAAMLSLFFTQQEQRVIMFVVVHVYFIVLLQLQLVSSREYVDAPGQLFCIFNVFHTTKGSQYCSKLRLRGGSLMPIIIKLLTLHNRDDAPCPCIYFFFDKSGIQAHCVGAHLRKSLIPFTALSSQRLNACTVVSLVTHHVMC